METKLQQKEKPTPASVLIALVKGTIPAAKKEEFEARYLKKVTNLPRGLEQSFLLRSIDDPEKYTIETVWGSREALEGWSLGTLFEAVGASPKIETHEVIETIP